MRSIILAMFFLWSVAPAAALVGGEQLAQNCKGGEPCQRPIECISFIVGVRDGILWGVSRGIYLSAPTSGSVYEKAVRLAGYCEPEGVTVSQIVEVAVKYVADHPKRVHEPAAELIRNALADAFPCGE